MHRRQFIGSLAAGAGSLAWTMRPVPALSIVAEGLRFPEGPVAMRDGGLLFVEIQGGTVVRLAPDGRRTVLARPGGGPNGLAVGPDGAIYIANNGGRFTFQQTNGVTIPGPPPPGHVGGSIQRLDPRSQQVTTLYTRSGGRRLVAPDDLVFDRRGGLWISDIGKTPSDGGIHYASTDGTHIGRAWAMEAPNGIGLSPDGGTLYVSARRGLYAFAITGPGRLRPSGRGPGGLLADLGDHVIADSLKVQADGRVCVCALLAGVIETIGGASPAAATPFPDPLTTNLAFGGHDLRDVWVTLSGTGRIGRLRWPSPGLRPSFLA